jgi:hypothetical protein
LDAVIRPGSKQMFCNLAVRVFGTFACQVERCFAMMISCVQKHFGKRGADYVDIY